MAIAAKYRFLLEVTEGLTLGVPNTSNPNLVHGFGNTQVNLSASTTPPVTTVVTEQVQLTAGEANLDLTSLSGPLSSSVDFSGLKLQLMKVQAAAANTGVVTMDPATANPYLFCPTTSNPKIGLNAGEMAMFYFNESLADVSSTALGIKFTSADVDAIVDLLLVAG